MKNIAIVFVCHDNGSINNVIHYDKYIIFVGDKNIDEEYINYPKLIIARNLKDNIENEKRLLTFTAWYAIIKNDLLLEYSHLCILEYDVSLYDSFEEKVTEIIKCNDGLSFDSTCYNGFIQDTNKEAVSAFLELKNIPLSIRENMHSWGCTTNQCIRRDILKDFVDWYYPDCMIIKNMDINKFSYYHERLFMIYLHFNNFEYHIDNSLLKHFGVRSHASYT